MNSRDRVRAAIRFRSPDRVPHRHTSLYSAWAAHPGLPDLFQRFPSDFSGDDGHAPTQLPRLLRKGTWTDEWGCTWTCLQDGILGQVTGFPCPDSPAMRRYVTPQPPRTSASDLAALAAKRDDRYLCAGWITTFERLIDLCGFENTMVGLHEGDPEFLDLLDRVVEHNLGVITDLIRKKPDGIFLADDWGSQTGPLLSPARWREVFAPRYRRLFAAVRDGGADVFFHSDGVTWPVLPDLVDLGVNVFWVDLTVNPPEHLVPLRGRVCFQTLTDVQYVLRSGTVEDVRRHVRNLLELVGTPTGGVIFCHEVAPDQPWDNVVACLEEGTHQSL